MQISQVRLRGFRNFRDATINLTKKSLIIGCNEIGKSNLLYALRILLDKSLSEADLEPQDSDFYVHEDTNEIKILVKFEEIYDKWFGPKGEVLLPMSTEYKTLLKALSYPD